ncbi:hypothetical protein ACUW02_006839 [Pseudomonas aeruginosa]|uniref:hypothetical protein n=1 Tax=Pseudomonas aeruginosa TaxID=287 RepID=UPI000B063940|nr:hypothetical protein [Pseudomonas aeruginosa]ELK4773344.1 hypothetical protein [Pseudomonas aeruginosa]WIK51991.1 hypothetical protein OI903_21900 [Pseudomonas aeruginosa]HEJ9774523.1 hypothetical protein [Pseudomonas aeruginosa]
MSNELTDVRCPCGAEFQADSYDAGFIAGSGMCQNCDAALPPKDICTCPSGDGSLSHPCPAHPAVEQAGGDERDFQAEGAQEVPSPVSQEYDRHLISLLRKGEALPGHQEEAADEIERLRDWNDHLNNTVLPNILNPNFLMLMKGGERLLDLCTKDGKFIGVSLNDMKDVFDWMVTHARIAPDHAALAQPSPASDLDPLNLAPHAEAFNEAPAEALKPEPAEADRPEVVAWQYRVTAGPQTGWSLWHPGKGEEFERSYTVERRPLMTVAQHERIVKAWIERWKAYIELSAKIAAQRDAANARLHEVATACATAEQERDAALAEVERLRESKGDPSGSFDRCMKMMYERDENAKRLDAALARVAELDKQCRDDVARALGLRPSQERGFAWSYLLASIKSCVKASEDAAQAQHSVPELLVRAEGFVSGFEDDDEQEGVSQLLADLRLAIGRAK